MVLAPRHAHSCKLYRHPAPLNRILCAAHPPSRRHGAPHHAAGCPAAAPPPSAVPVVLLASCPGPPPLPHTHTHSPAACPARLVALLDRRAFVYDLESLALLGTLDTPPNPRGMAALTRGGPAGDHPGAPCLLALPAGGGAVRVYDVGRPAGGVDALCELQAHKTAVVGGQTGLAWTQLVLLQPGREDCTRRPGSMQGRNPYLKVHEAAAVASLCCRRPLQHCITSSHTCCRRCWRGTTRGRCWPPHPRRARWCGCTR